MTLKSNFSINKLFVSKIVKISVGNQGFLSVKLHTVGELLEDTEWGRFYELITCNPETKFLPQTTNKMDTFDFIELVSFNLGQYQEYRMFYNLIRQQLPLLFHEQEVVFDMKTKKIIVNDITMNSEIWNYIVYILQLSYGEKVSQPLTFDSEEARQFFLAQQEMEQKIKATRAKAKAQESKDVDDSIAKILLSIVYAFPSLTFDYLLDQTMAQVQWLQQYAAKSVSYNINAQALAAGNMKKGSKLDFFIK